MNLPPRKPPQRVIDPIAEYDSLRPLVRTNETWQERFDRRYRELKPGDWFGKAFNQHRGGRAA